MMRVLLISSGLLGPFDLAALEALAHMRGIQVIVDAQTLEGGQELRLIKELTNLPVVVLTESEPKQEHELRLGFDLPVLPSPDISLLTVEAFAVTRKVERPMSHSRDPPRRRTDGVAIAANPATGHAGPDRVSSPCRPNRDHGGRPA
jgi:hypothetical protein